MDSIKNWFNELDERDQKITLVGAVLFVVVMLYLFLLSPMNNAVAELRVSVASKQKSVDYMKQQVPLFLGNKGSSTGAKSTLPLSSVVNSSTQKYSLPVSRRDSKSPNEMQVWFDNVPFDSFLKWVSELKTRYGVTVASVNVRSQDRNGITSINVKLVN